MWFRRRRRKRVGKPFDSSLLPPTRFHTVDQAAEEGVMLVQRAARMHVKNRILIDALTGSTNYDEGRYREVAKATLERLGAEAELGATRIADLKQQLVSGAASYVDIERYSSDDIDNMDHRSEVSHSVAQRLQELNKDNDYLDALVEAARDAAWGEIASAIDTKLGAQFVVVDENYERERDKRLKTLIDVDLASLIAS